MGGVGGGRREREEGGRGSLGAWGGGEAQRSRSPQRVTLAMLASSCWQAARVLSWTLPVHTGFHRDPSTSRPERVRPRAQASHRHHPSRPQSHRVWVGGGDLPPSGL